MKKIIDYVKNNKNMFLMIGVFLLIAIAGTFAWLTWKSKETSLVLKVGDVDGLSVTLYPYQIKEEIASSLTSENEIFTTIEAKNNSNKTQSFKLFYKIKEIDDDLKGNLKYSLVKENSGGTTVSVKTDNFLDVSSGEDLIITTLSVPNKTTDNYKLYLWLDGESENVTTETKSIINASLGVEIIKQPNMPSIDENGMIPVTIANDGTVTTIKSDDDNWYDYGNQEWANAVLITDDSRSTYLNTTGVTIPEDNILAYYVWIPRYKYKIWTTGTGATGQEQEIDIVFESKNEKSTGSQVGEYLTHPAFWWDSDSDGIRDEGEELSGIWVGKFETTGTEDNPTIKPNVAPLTGQTVSAQFQTILKFSGGTLSNGITTFVGSSTYGLGNGADSHMAKNTEWAAAAYLSHSRYGANTEVRINNNLNFTTGCGASTADALESDTCQITYGASNEYPQSTTGNITGIFDMSGGQWETVMGVFANSDGTLWSGESTTSNSGFNGLVGNSNTAYTSGIPFPESKYYDVYKASNGTTINESTACNSGYCYGHALSETVGWYSDYAEFVSSDAPWFYRGGYYNAWETAGAFYFSGNMGSGILSEGTRAALIQEGV